MRCSLTFLVAVVGLVLAASDTDIKAWLPGGKDTITVRAADVDTTSRPEEPSESLIFNRICRLAHWDAHVKMTCRVDKRGQVTEVRIVSSNTKMMMDSIAVAHAMLLKFAPAAVRKRDSSTWTMFDLDGRSQLAYSTPRARPSQENEHRIFNPYAYTKLDFFYGGDYDLQLLESIVFPSTYYLCYQQGFEGVVLVSAVVDGTGAVVKASVAGSWTTNASLVSLALETVRTARFNAGSSRRNGRVIVLLVTAFSSECPSPVIIRY